MKRIILGIVVAAGVSACSSGEAGPDAQAGSNGAGILDANKIVVATAINELWNKGNLDHVDVAFAKDYVGIDPVNPEPTRDLAALKKTVTMYRTAFPDLNFSVQSQAAESDWVATRWNAKGTQQGELMGVKPTNKPVDVGGITLARLENGQEKEAFTVWDTLGMMVQLGVVPMPPMKEPYTATAPTPQIGVKPTAAEARQWLDTWVAAVNTCDITKVATFVADDFVNHSVRPGMDPTKAGFVKEFSGMCQGMPDMKFEIGKTIFQDGALIVQVTITATHTGKTPMLPPPTGKKIKVVGIDWLIVADGKMKERWGYFDEMGMMKQLGLIPEPSASADGEKPAVSSR